MEKVKANTHFSVRDIAYVGLCVALMAVCSWISIPLTVPVTLQTFAVFLTVSLLGGKLGTVAVCVFILLGAIGAPVFSGFKGGIGVLLGTTGGYIIGFIFTALIMWLFERLFKSRAWSQILSMVLGLLVCYAFGTAWFMIVYINSNGAVSLVTVLGWCVIPFIIPDIVKIALAFSLSKALKRAIKL